MRRKKRLVSRSKNSDCQWDKCRVVAFREGRVSVKDAKGTVCVRHYKEVMGECQWPTCEVTYGKWPLCNAAGSGVLWYCQIHHGYLLRLRQESDGWIHDCSFLGCEEIHTGSSQDIWLWWFATQVRAAQTASDLRAEVLRDEQERQARGSRKVLRDKTSRKKTVRVAARKG